MTAPADNLICLARARGAACARVNDGGGPLVPVKQAPPLDDLSGPARERADALLAFLRARRRLWELNAEAVKAALAEVRE